MPLTHILVDYENTKPSAADVALLRDEVQHLWICRGPNEKKYDAEFFEALHALGPRLHFVRCAKSGRNALDMHIAFQMGFLMGEARDSGAAPFAFVVVSRDTDYEPLLLYIRSLGCVATRARTIREALGAVPAEKPAVAKATKTKATAPSQARVAAAGPARRGTAVKAKPGKKAPAAKEAVAGKDATATKEARATKATRAAAKSGAARAAAKSAPALAPVAEVSPSSLETLVDKVVDHLHTHPRNRPTRRDKLQSLVQSHLRTRLAGADIGDIVERLERRGVVRFAGNKIEYPQWT